MKWLKGLDMGLYAVKAIAYLTVSYFAIISFTNPMSFDVVSFEEFVTSPGLKVAILAAILEVVHNVVGFIKASSEDSEQRKFKEEIMKKVKEEDQKNKDAILKELEEKLKIKLEEDGD
ncbi:TPA: hypothetical protein QCX99_000486 [Bacillus thuringiensis]|nr:hypothetical protein [Bacillus thuringiensis]